MEEKLNKDWVGKVARCGNGRLAVIIDRVKGPYPTGEEEIYWVGLPLDGDGPWTSRNPTIEHESLEKYIKWLIEKKFDQYNLREKKE